MTRSSYILFMAALVAAFLCAPGVVRADDVIPRGLGHPKEGGVHWYDGGCCSRRDCEPVEQGAIVVTKDGYQVRYLTSRGQIATGFLPHGASGIRQSKDAQEHACAPTDRVICIYIHLGV